MLILIIYGDKRLEQNFYVRRNRSLEMYANKSRYRMQIQRYGFNCATEANMNFSLSVESFFCIVANSDSHENVNVTADQRWKTKVLSEYCCFIIFPIENSVFVINYHAGKFYSVSLFYSRDSRKRPLIRNESVYTVYEIMQIWFQLFMHSIFCCLWSYFRVNFFCLSCGRKRVSNKK